MKILITGSNGMLGVDLVNLLSEENDVTGIDIQDLDICNIENVLNCTRKIMPKLIINCAAYTDVDGCETEVELAYKVNAIGPRNLAIACNDLDIPLLHISTDYVFDGEGELPYLERDFPNPLSIYGKSKLEGENFVKTMTKKYYIIRTQWLFGKNGKNFVKTIVKLAKEHREIKVVNDQFGCPTYTKDLCYAVGKLIDTKNYGTYHLTNSEIVTWYDFTKEILSQSKLDDVKLIPCTTSEVLRPAKRPAYSPLENFYWELCGFEPMRNYKLALRDYLEDEKML